MRCSCFVELDARAADRGVLFASDMILPRSIQQNKSRYIPAKRQRAIASATEILK